jgi:hypothetical protein
MSRSRSTKVDFVRIENGLAASPSASMIPRVRRNLPSARWYGSVLVPMAMASPFQRAGESSARSRSTALTFTTITVSKSRPASRPSHAWVGRAKQYVQAWLQPR